MPGPNQSVLLARRSDRAFTLVELTIVLLVMVLLAAIAAPTYYSSINFHHVESSARRIKADLELVQQLARETGSPGTVSFDVAEEIYRVPPLKGLVSGVAGSSVVDLDSEPYHCDIQSALIGGKPWVTFDRFGLPQAPGGIALAAGGHVRTVSIDGATGEIDIQTIVAVETPPKAEAAPELGTPPGQFEEVPAFGS